MLASMPIEAQTKVDLSHTTPCLDERYLEEVGGHLVNRMASNPQEVKRKNFVAKDRESPLGIGGFECSA